MPEGKIHLSLTDEYDCNIVTYGHGHCLPRKSTLSVEDVAISVRCLFNTAGHLPDSHAIVMHSSVDDGTYSIASVHNNGDMSVLRVPVTYLRSVNSSNGHGDETDEYNVKRSSMSLVCMYAIADENSTLIGIELADGIKHDSCEDISSIE